MFFARISFFIFCFFLRLTINGQSVSRELLFAKHLIIKKNYDEAIYVLNELNKHPQVSSLQRDSIHFFLGNIYYDQKQLTHSIENFDLVSNTSARLKSEAVFFATFNHAYLKSYPTALEQLFKFIPTDSSQQQLRNLEMAGVFLLLRNFKKYDSLSKFFLPTNYAVDQQEKNMSEQYSKIIDQPKKSPWVAALLSTVLPGAGKFYAGNKGQAFYTLIISSVLGLQAWEGYRKDGPSSFRFIAYSTVFASLYIGTIWGSAFSVKIRRDQINETINDQILFDMHIPLRTVFH